MQTIKTALLRTLSLFIVWWALTEGDSSGAVFGAVVSLLVALVSIRLFPPGTYAVRPGSYRLRILGVLSFTGHFVGNSVIAGVDVARRLLLPRLPVDPGSLTLTTRLPEGSPRWLLANALSLMPGTLSVNLIDDQLELHCLDQRMPVTAFVRQTEARIAAMYGITPPDDSGAQS
ncbi:multicomponent Na+:H+ antiporter subunit E [Halospina denitrificans]|uniref:Multicomponent Na+:H+ antiporter subunit E n=1 Tax=Halospina denitrificans TaxID=332522 RepID=A0A4R7JZ27_9GAMM|nr:Na+/H+ antiporter subunit E [Halospina denitrificans]TDT43356.1 multicomponent Na+:H+ antiporter subunit E [Halospina denitrificans]